MKEALLVLAVLIVLAVIIVVVARTLTASSRSKKANEAKQEDQQKEDPLKGKKYHARESLLTDNEYDFYIQLVEAFPKANIQVQQVLYSFIEQEKEYFNQRPTGLYKSVDFLICNEELVPLVAIEVNDKSHNSLDRQKRDEFVLTLLDHCKIPLEVFQASDSNSAGEIKKRLKKYM